MSPRRITPARVPEKAEQAHIVQLLRWVGGQVYVMGTRRRRGDHPGTMQTPGIPDLMAFLPPRAGSTRRVFLFIECKARGGRMSPEQREFRELAIGAELAHLVGGLDTVIAWLAEQGYTCSDRFPHYRQPVRPALPVTRSV
jgi:hypothetical protein